jgi:hypothetical protein
MFRTFFTRPSSLFGHSGSVASWCA